MKLTPPVAQYITGNNPTHSGFAALSQKTNTPPEKVIAVLQKYEYLTAENKPTPKALKENIVDVCDRKLLWNLKQVKSLIALSNRVQTTKTNPDPLPQNTNKEFWVDLDTIGTYFGVSKIQVGKWLDQLGLRAMPEIPVNESGAVDMLDMANQAKEKQAVGFLAKKPTEDAIARGFARIDIVTGKKDKVYEITKWNLEKVKAVLVKNGHELDTERKMMLKGKGKNSDVKVSGLDERAMQIYQEWKKLHRNPKTKADSWNVFRGQPTIILAKVEAMMGAPNFLQKKKYLTEDL